MKRWSKNYRCVHSIHCGAKIKVKSLKTSESKVSSIDMDLKYMYIKWGFFCICFLSICECRTADKIKEWSKKSHLYGFYETKELAWSHFRRSLVWSRRVNTWNLTSKRNQFTGRKSLISDKPLLHVCNKCIAIHHWRNPRYKAI